MDQINELSAMVLDIAFTDEAGDPTTPSAAVYRIDDSSGEEILDDTPITGLAPTVSITIPGDLNRILDQSRYAETRMVTLRWTYGTPAKQGTAEYKYRIRNLAFIDKMA